MPEQPLSSDAGSQTAVASYVASLSADLSAMARRTGLDSLGYLLDIVRLEAENLARHSPNGGNGSQ